VRLATGCHKTILDPYGYRWYRAGNLSHIIRREKTSVPPSWDTVITLIAWFSLLLAGCRGI
jgi:hypothetical protein